MIRGLYTGASGMMAQMNYMDALSNNLANADLVGYKRDTAVSKAFPQMLLRRMNDSGVHNFPMGSVDSAPIVGRLGTGVEVNEVFTIFEQGAMKQTDNPFDLAMEGEGFLCVETEDGERYTRNGSFVLGKEGFLLTKSGDLVLGENGPIKLKKNNFIIDEDGVVYQNSSFSEDENRLVSLEENEWENIERVDRLKVVDFKRTRYLQKQGDSQWLDTEFSGEAEIVTDGKRPKIRQGFLESANVNPVTEMVKMIEVNRSYEANSKLIQTEDSLLGKLINEAVRV
ncbi:MAG: flagellar hook-basal body protein [Spirochaetales bacterium]|nr:flagellar hook-basal body protein [Spirochaetales bacterium]